MKKNTMLFSLLLAGSLFMSSCGDIVISKDNDEIEDEREGEREDEEKKDDESTSDTDAQTTADDTEVPDENAGETENVVGDTSSIQPKEFTKGTVSADGVYESEWIGIKFTPVGSLVMATEEEMNAIFAQSGELMGVDGADRLSYEMIAQDAATGSSVNIIVEKLAFSNITEAQYLAASKAQLNGQLADGMEMTDITEYTMMLCGKKYSVLDYSVSFFGLNYRVIQLYRKVDDRLICITVSDFNDSADTLFDCFSAY